MTRLLVVASSLSKLCVVLALMAPWLVPPQNGPSPAVLPWLFSLACTGLLSALWFGYRSLIPTISPVAVAWLAAALISSTIGLCQYFGLEAYFSPWMSPSSHLGEAFANLRQRNQFASLTNMGLVALVWLKVNCRFVGRHLWQAWPVASLLAVGNAVSSSRTGLLQLVLLCVLCWVWVGWRQLVVRRIFLVAVLTYVLATVALPWVVGLDPLGHGILARLRTGDTICAGRLTLWSNVLHLIAQKPWFGWGWGQLDYAHYMTPYPGARFCDILDNAHNLPLHLAVEVGIPVALVVCGVGGGVVWRVKPWRETDSTRQMAWGVLALILLHSMLEYPLWYGPFQMAFGLCVWMLWPAPREPTEGLRPYAHVSSAMRFILATALLIAAAYAAWDYRRVSQIYLAPQARVPAYRDDTLDKARGSWLFRNHVRFAELTTTALGRDNAQWTFDTSMALLHYSPEPRVIEKLIESAVMQGRNDEALQHLIRYRAAFPYEYARWRNASGLAGGLGD